MLSNKEAQIPNNLLSFAQKSPNLSAGIICANHDSSIESAKKTVNSFMADTKKQASIIEKFKPLLPKKNALDDVMKWLKKEIN